MHLPLKKEKIKKNKKISKKVLTNKTKCGKLLESSRDHGSIAQLGEHLPYKQRVIGSSPIVSTRNGPVAQLVRALACHARGRGFDPHPDRHF